MPEHFKPGTWGKPEEQPTEQVRHDSLPTFYESQADIVARHGQAHKYGDIVHAFGHRAQIVGYVAPREWPGIYTEEKEEAGYSLRSEIIPIHKEGSFFARPVSVVYFVAQAGAGEAEQMLAPVPEGPLPSQRTPGNKRDGVEPLLPNPGGTLGNPQTYLPASGKREFPPAPPRPDSARLVTNYDPNWKDDKPEADEAADEAEEVQDTDISKMMYISVFGTMRPVMQAMFESFVKDFESGGFTVIVESVEQTATNAATELGKFYYALEMGSKERAWMNDDERSTYNQIINRLADEREIDGAPRDVYGMGVADTLDELIENDYNLTSVVRLRNGYDLHKANDPADVRTLALTEAADAKPHKAAYDKLKKFRLLLSMIEKELTRNMDAQREAAYTVIMRENAGFGMRAMTDNAELYTDTQAIKADILTDEGAVNAMEAAMIAIRGILAGLDMDRISQELYQFSESNRKGRT